MPRMYYGDWYVEPDTWQRRHGRQVETRGGAEREDNTKVGRKAVSELQGIYLLL